MPQQRTSRSAPEHILFLSAGILLAALFVWFEWRLLLLAFAGLLVSILLHATASWVERKTPLSSVWAYVSTLIAITGGVVGLVILLAPHVITQISQVAATLPLAAQKAQAYLDRTSWGAALLHVVHTAWQSKGSKLAIAALTMVESSIDLFIVIVIGFFGALNPRRYRNGLLALVPPDYRRGAKALTEVAARTLRSWLLGQMIPMIVLGLASMIALWILKVPLAFTIGMLTGVMVFVPYLGSIASGVLAILLALERSPYTALYVFILYCVFHLLEGYILTPLVQRKAVHLPPILTILVQFFFWSFGGILGVAVAAPLAAVALQIIKILLVRPDSHDQSLEHTRAIAA